jgi:DNA repair photolyase
LLTPELVDCISFCTKNPAPMLDRLDEISKFRQFWFVTITPYGKEIEPNVPNKIAVMESFKKLSDAVGVNAVGWRYDPIFITDKYSVDFHINAFEKMAENLSGYVDNCVISFIDLYQKTKRNFGEAKEVTKQERAEIGKVFAAIGEKYGIKIRTCCEGQDLARYGVDVSGCMTQPIIERAIGESLNVPKRKKSPREACNCLLGNDIGMYNTCPHGCVYCYANYNRRTVVENLKRHDPKSPFLIGGSREGDVIKNAKQKTYINGQINLF